MTIAIITSGDYFSDYGGGQVYVRNLVEGLWNKGHDICVVSMETDADVEETVFEIQKENGISVMQIRVAEKDFDATLPLELQSGVLNAVKQALGQSSVQVAHANGWKTTTSLVCEELGIPCIVTAHHGGIVCPNGMLMNEHDAICDKPASAENCLECALHFVPGGDFWAPVVKSLPYNLSLQIAGRLESVRNIPYTSPAFRVPLGINRRLRQIEVLRTAPTRIVAPSHAIAKALKRNGFPEEKLTVIPHGIRPLGKRPLTPGLPSRPLRFGYVGRIAYIKGLHILLEALRQLPEEMRNYELHIYGDAANREERRYKRQLEQMAEGLPVVWHGKIAYNRIVEAYESFDVTVFPSICLEVFGLSILESLSTGRPVIATRCGGPEDILTDGKDGLLVEPNDAEAMTEALYRFLSDSEELESFCSNITEIRTLQQHIADLEALYEEISK